MDHRRFVITYTSPFPTEMPDVKAFIASKKQTKCLGVFPNVGILPVYLTGLAPGIYQIIIEGHTESGKIWSNSGPLALSKGFCSPCSKDN